MKPPAYGHGKVGRSEIRKVRSLALSIEQKALRKVKRVQWTVTDALKGSIIQPQATPWVTGKSHTTLRPERAIEKVVEKSKVEHFVMSAEKREKRNYENQFKTFCTFLSSSPHLLVSSTYFS